MEENRMTDSDEEKGFEVVDKRKVTMDEDGEIHTHPENETPEVHEDEGPDLSGLPPVDILSLIRYFMSMLSAQSWQWMGLVKNPATGNIEQDLDQAKTAIDTIAAMVQVLEPKVTQAEKDELQRLLSDLRINFVQQSSRN
jgi:hypothetical protein